MVRDLFEVRVGAYIFNDKDEMLLLLNRDKTWGILGGHMEKGEQIEETLHREIKEETDLEVEMVKLFNIRAVHEKDSFILGFACKYNGGEIKLQEDEIGDYKWVKLDELKNFNLTFEEMPVLIKEALEIVKAKN
jgi:NADH pyrophosphatase NudC (nudix superfamily)